MANVFLGNVHAPSETADVDAVRSYLIYLSRELNQQFNTFNAAYNTSSHTRAHLLLSAADHTDVATYLNQAVLTSSTPTFNGLSANSQLITNVLTPVSGTDAANKNYVDLAVSSIKIDEYFASTASDIGGIYYVMHDSPAAAGTVVSSGVTADSTVNIFDFATLSGHPHLDRLVRGTYDIHAHLKKTGVKSVYCYCELYQRTSGGVETLLATSANTANLTTSDLVYDVYLTLDTEVTLATTDRLVIKWYGVFSGAASSTTVTMTVGGTADSHFTVNIEVAELTSIFVPYTGAENDVDLGTHTLTTTGAITALSYTIGANTLTTTEFGYLDGQDQTVKTTSSPTFVNVSLVEHAQTILFDVVNDASAVLSINASIWTGAYLYVGGVTFGAGIKLENDSGTLKTAANITGAAITGTSFVIGANTLDTNEWALLDGQDQAVKKASDVQHATLSIGAAKVNYPLEVTGRIGVLSATADNGASGMFFDYATGTGKGTIQVSGKDATTVGLLDVIVQEKDGGNVKTAIAINTSGILDVLSGFMIGSKAITLNGGKLESDFAGTFTGTVTTSSGQINLGSPGSPWTSWDKLYFTSAHYIQGIYLTGVEYGLRVVAPHIYFLHGSDVLISTEDNYDINYSAYNNAGIKMEAGGKMYFEASGFTTAGGILANTISTGEITSMSYATLKGNLAIAQADVSGLTTASSPTFAGLTVNGNAEVKSGNKLKLYNAGNTGSRYWYMNAGTYLETDGWLKCYAIDSDNGGTFQTGIVINESGADVDTRIEGDTDANLLFVDASTDRICIGANNPAAGAKLDVRGAIHAIQPGARAYRNATQTIGNTTWTKVQLNTETYDILGEFDSATNYRYTATVAGYYQVNAGVRYSTAGTTTLTRLLICKNGAPGAGTLYGAALTLGTGTITSLNSSDIIYLAVNDYVEIYTYHNEGGDLTVAADQENCYLSIMKIA